MKSVVIGLVVLVFVGGGVFWFTTQNGSGSTVQDEVEGQVVDGQSDVDDGSGEGSQEDSSSSAGGQYVEEYSEEVFESFADRRRVIFFYANWCPTCQPADRDFREKMSEIPDDVVVFKVNYNDPETDEIEDGLADEYGVTYQHTFVQVDENGETVTSWNGGDLDELLANLE